MLSSWPFDVNSAPRSRIYLAWGVGGYEDGGVVGGGREIGE